MMNKVITAGITAAIIAGFSMVSHAAPVKDMNVDISGVGQIVYSWGVTDSLMTGITGKRLNNDGFDLNHMRLVIKAAPAEHVSFYSQLELTRKVIGDSKIADMYVDLTYVPQATLRVGQFKLPNSYELNTAPYEKELINDTIAVQEKWYSSRQRGLLLTGSPIKEFSWGIVASNGTVGAVNDDDAALYVLQLNYIPVENLSFKIWGATQQESVTAPNVDAMGIGFNYTVSGLHLSGEYNTRSVETATTDDIDELYVTAAYKIPESNFQIVGRYEDITAKSDGADDGDGNVFSAGVNWDFEKDARLQLSHELTGGDLEDNDRTDLQLSVRF